MPLTGTLRSWNDDRGFGFIAPTDGGRELFVHISAFPRDGSRPTVGESLSYELGRGKDGKPAAVRVWRQALGRPDTYPRTRPAKAPAGQRSPWRAVLALPLLIGIGALAFWKLREAPRPPAASLSAPVQTAPSPTPAAITSSFRCDGRTRCSHMTSCNEAMFFLRNCPGTQMDGNHDGVPCEEQWCGGGIRR